LLSGKWDKNCTCNVKEKKNKNKTSPRLGKGTLRNPFK
jgi:hypothetical protein